MKKYAFFIIIIFVQLNIYAQPVLFKCKPNDSKHGIASSMEYQAIIKSNCTQKQLIDKTKEWMKKNDLFDYTKFKLDTINDKKVEFTLPFGFRFGAYCGKGAFGAKMYKAPMYLNFDAKFSFGTQGSIKIEFTNFREVPFFLVENNKYYTGANEGMLQQMGNSFNGKDQDEAHLKRDSVWAFFQQSCMETSSFLKALTLLSGGVEGYHKTLEEITKNSRMEFALYDRAASKSIGKWFTKGIDEMIPYFDEKAPGAKWQIPMALERAEAHYLLCMDNDRWDNHAQKAFNAIFYEFSTLINGELQGIQKDTELLFKLENGALVKAK
ncbi:MAG TPA: hypothetical protein PLU10_03055 [Chitinophagaceae bacterium]|nr:hypothetical protein [Chitinophagaceae bacterium]